MKHISEIDQLANALDNLPRPRVLVPTMGALHQGHLALVERARELAGAGGTVILTVFVNPTQFNKSEDLKSYPRPLKSDLDLCKEQGVDLVFTPDSTTVYHDDSSVTVTENSLSNRLCGDTRPGHFNGVCTIVLKLLNLTQPDVAVFGKKDYQQLAIIRRMARDLNVPTRIEGVETVRENFGLALSSRNVRLTAAQHTDASHIRKALLQAEIAYQSGASSVDTLVEIAQSEMDKSTQGAIIDYLELLDAETLQPIKTVTRPAVMAIAVYYDTVRLIDNIEII